MIYLTLSVFGIYLALAIYRAIRSDQGKRTAWIAERDPWWER